MHFAQKADMQIKNKLEQADSNLRPHIMAYGEKGISVLTTIFIMLIGQNPYSNMNNSLMKVVHI